MTEAACFRALVPYLRVGLAGLAIPVLLPATYANRSCCGWRCTFAHSFQSIR